MTKRPDRRDVGGPPNHNNPLAKVAGAPPTLSPPTLSPPTLRLLLAVFAILSCAGFAAAAEMVGVHWLAITLIVLAVIAVMAAMGIVLIVRRKHQGRPG
jgi:Flp pilus assembly protein TadB